MSIWIYSQLMLLTILFRHIVFVPHVFSIFASLLLCVENCSYFRIFHELNAKQYLGMFHPNYIFITTPL